MPLNKQNLVYIKPVVLLTCRLFLLCKRIYQTDIDLILTLIRKSGTAINVFCRQVILEEKRYTFEPVQVICDGRGLCAMTLLFCPADLIFGERLEPAADGSEW
jgi:hypothetical protein